jgi:hypothetical protein
MMDSAKGDKLTDAVRHAAQQRPGSEHDQANLEHAPSSKTV